MSQLEAYICLGVRNIFKGFELDECLSHYHISQHQQTRFRLRLQYGKSVRIQMIFVFTLKCNRIGWPFTQENVSSFVACLC